MKCPELVSATQAQLDELLALAKASFPSAQYELLKGVLGTFAYGVPPAKLHEFCGRSC